MTPLRRGALFAVAFVLLLIVFAPLRFALDRAQLGTRGLSAAEVTGTIWSGELRGASYQGLALGDARVGLRPLPLLVGRVRLAVETLGGPAPGRAVMVSGGGRDGIVDANLVAPVQMLNAPLPLLGDLRLEDVAVVFRDGACERASGRVTTNILQRSAGFLQWQGPELAGELTCRGRSLAAPLTGARDGTRVALTLRFEGDGRYRADTRVLTVDPALGSALGLAGFQPGVDGLMRVDQGRLTR